MPDLANCCKHYPKEKISRDPPEITEIVVNHHILCNVFGHNWKVEEIRWRTDADEETDNLENFRLTGIIRQCKRCEAVYWEYFPHDRFKEDLENIFGECDEIE